MSLMSQAWSLRCEDLAIRGKSEQDKTEISWKFWEFIEMRSKKFRARWCRVKEKQGNIVLKSALTSESDLLGRPESLTVRFYRHWFSMASARGDSNLVDLAGALPPLALSENLFHYFPWRNDLQHHVGDRQWYSFYE
jgi:hypothetical protein